MSGRIEWVLAALERARVRYLVVREAALGFRPQTPVPSAHPGFAVDLFVQEPFDFDAVYKLALRVPLAVNGRRIDGVTTEVVVVVRGRKNPRKAAQRRGLNFFMLKLTLQTHDLTPRPRSLGPAAPIGAQLPSSTLPGKASQLR